MWQLVLRRIAAGPLVRQLQKWMAELDLRVSPHCEKAQPGANPRAKCRFCPPLFPKHLDGRRNKDGFIEPMRPQAVSDCVKLAMKAIGVDAKRISGRSMRRGGITAARLAGVAEDSVDIHFCHGQHRVGRRRYTTTWRTSTLCQRPWPRASRPDTVWAWSTVRQSASRSSALW